jgi:hypothetical protein
MGDMSTIGQWEESSTMGQWEESSTNSELLEENFISPIRDYKQRIPPIRDLEKRVPPISEENPITYANRVVKIVYLNLQMLMGHRLLRNLVDFASQSWSTLSMPSILNGDKMLSSILKNHCNTTNLVLLSTV